MLEDRMGSYAQLFAGGLFITSSKNDYSPRVLYLFDSDEKVYCDISEADLPLCLAHYKQAYSEEGESFKVLFFRTNTSFLSDRLNYYGYSKNVADEAFRRWMAAEARQKREMANSDSLKAFSEKLHSEADLLESLTPDQWVETFMRKSSPSPEEALIREALDGYYGLFPIIDDLVAVRLIVDRLPTDTDFIYDLTDLYLSEMADPDFDLFLQENFSFQDDVLSRSRTVVLVEGGSDANILSSFIEFAYPHLVSKLSFFQFNDFSAPSGAGHLANLVKSFAAAGILNRTVAIFDNDTAGNEAMLSIPQEKLPRNIKVIRLPDIEIAKDYPTRGPTGVARLDVNGLAASLELYLGEAALRRGTGKLAEIQWTGYNRKLGRYQGEVLGKFEVQKEYFRKLRERPDPCHPDWRNLDLIVEALISCFAEELRHSILVHIENEVLLR